MDRQLMGQLAGAGSQRAPSAARPSGGMGNIPYAKGIMSGAFGQIPKRGGPERAAPDGPDPGISSAPAPAAPQSGGPPSPQGAPPNPMAMQAGAQNPFLDRMFYFDIMGSIMMALVQAAESPEGPY